MVEPKVEGQEGQEDRAEERGPTSWCLDNLHDEAMAPKALATQRRHAGRQVKGVEIAAHEDDARVGEGLRPVLDFHLRQGQLHQLRAGVRLHQPLGPLHLAGQALQKLA